jgi:hypothetical protein
MTDYLTVIEVLAIHEDQTERLTISAALAALRSLFVE